MIELGWKRYSKLSKAEKENISEKIGAVGGGVLGFGTITAAIGALGIPGLSAAGIASGLAALGTIVGGGMAAGISVAAAIPIAAACLGYAVIKAVKFFVEEHELDAEKYDPFWERPLRILMGTATIYAFRWPASLLPLQLALKPLFQLPDKGCFPNRPAQVF